MLFRKNIEPRCAYCARGTRIDETHVACVRRGVVDVLVRKSYSAAYGARNLRRCIQKELEDPMAVRIIESFDHPITHICASASGEKVTLETL